MHYGSVDAVSVEELPVVVARPLYVRVGQKQQKCLQWVLVHSCIDAANGTAMNSL